MTENTECESRPISRELNNGEAVPKSFELAIAPSRLATAGGMETRSSLGPPTRGPPILGGRTTDRGSERAAIAATTGG